MAARKRFEGRDVIGSVLTVTGAGADGDGRDPYIVGDRVFLVCEAVVDRVTHRAIKDSDALERVAHCRSLIGAVVDVDLVREALELARMAAEAREGVQRLDLDSGDGS